MARETSIGTLAVDLELRGDQFARTLRTAQTSLEGIGAAARSVEQVSVAQQAAASSAEEMAAAAEQQAQAVEDVNVELPPLIFGLGRFASGARGAGRAALRLAARLRPLAGPAGAIGGVAAAIGVAVIAMENLSDRVQASADRLRELGLLGEDLEDRLAELNEQYRLSAFVLEAHTNVLVREAEQERIVATRQAQTAAAVSAAEDAWDRAKFAVSEFFARAQAGLTAGVLGTLEMALFGTSTVFRDYIRATREAAEGTDVFTQIVEQSVEDLANIQASEAASANRAALQAVARVQREGGEEAARAFLGAYQAALLEQDPIQLAAAMRRVTERALESLQAALPSAPTTPVLDLVFGSPEAVDRSTGSAAALAERINEAAEARDRLALAEPPELLPPDLTNVVQTTVEQFDALDAAAVVAAQQTMNAWEGVGDTISGLIRTTQSWGDLLRSVGALAIEFLGFLAGGGQGGLRGFFGFPTGGNQFGGQLLPGETRVVGERGPELIRPLGPARVTPTNQLAGEAAGSVTNIIQPTLQMTEQQFDTFLSRRIADGTLALGGRARG